MATCSGARTKATRGRRSRQGSAPSPRAATISPSRSTPPSRRPPRTDSLEPEVEGREAELGAAEDGGGLLGVVAGVGAHGVDVAPGALDRVGEEDAAPAAGV